MNNKTIGIIPDNKEIITLPMNKEKPIIVILGQRRMGMSVSHRILDYYKHNDKEE